MDYAALVSGLTTELGEVTAAVGPFLIAVLGVRIGWKLVKGFSKSA